MDADGRFAALSLELPPAPKPMGTYKPISIVGNLAFLSGHGPLKADKTLIIGKVGADLTLEQGKLAAQQVGLALLATLKSQLGSLARVGRVVKVLGMVNATPDFTEQPQVQAGEKVLRPDLIVRMPESRELVVDAKTPLDAYMDAVEASDDDARRGTLGRHARHVEQRVRELGQKSYWEQFEHSPEFAVLFLPGDQFLSAALAERPELLESALKQSIIIATPSTLMALLKVVAYGWRQAAASQNAAEIRELGQELHRRLATFVGHLQKVGRSLDNALAAYNSAAGSFERNVTPQARRFTELGATADVLPNLEPAEQIVRLPQPPLESGEDSPPPHKNS